MVDSLGFDIENTWHDDRPGTITILTNHGRVFLQSTEPDGDYRYFGFTPEQAKKIAAQLVRAAEHITS